MPTEDTRLALEAAVPPVGPPIPPEIDDTRRPPCDCRSLLACIADRSLDASIIEEPSSSEADELALLRRIEGRGGRFSSEGDMRGGVGSLDPREDADLGLVHETRR